MANSLTSEIRYLIKIVVLGDSGYMKKDFIQQYQATLSADFLHKDVQIEDRPLSLQIWDTAGQERFQSLSIAYCRGADCCVLVYDVNVLGSFANLDKWHDRFLEQCKPTNPATFPFVLLGNKVDIDDGISRRVTENTARKWCASRGNIPYFETSAKEDINVDAAFLHAAELVLLSERAPGISFFDRQPAPQEPAPQTEQRSRCAC